MAWLDDLTRSNIDEWRGVLWAAGIADGNLYCEFSDDGGATKGTFRAGGTRRLIAEGVGDEQPGVKVHEHNADHLIVVTGTNTYVSKDAGEHWAHVDSI